MPEAISPRMKLATIKQTAAFLQCDHKTVRRLVDGGRIPFIVLSHRKNRCIRIRLDLLIEQFEEETFGVKFGAN